MRLDRSGLTTAIGYLVLLAAPLLAFSDPYRLGIANLVVIYLMLALSFDVIFGHAGQISLGHIGFMALGAYATAILAGGYGWPPLVAAMVGVAVATVLAVIIGLITARMYSHYLALATIGVSEIIRITAINATGITRGTGGIVGIPPLPGASIFTDGATGNYIVSAALVVLFLIGAHRLGGRPTGRRLAAVATSETAAASVGLSAVVEKTKALVISAIGAAVAGSVYAHTVGFVSPDAFGFSPMFLLLAIGVVGGKRHPAGITAAAVVLVSLPEFLRQFGVYWQLGFGAGLLLAVLLLPGGIGPALSRRRQIPDSPNVPEGTGPLDLELSAPQRADDITALELSGLSKNFGGVRALDDASLSIAQGEIHALIGPNGAGKTTLINLTSGVWKPDSGTITLAGEAITGTGPDRIARAGLARTFQNIQLFDGSSVLDNVLVSAEGNRANVPDPVSTAWACLRAVGIDHHGHHEASSLPYGTQRLLEIARCLATRPRVLLLDEPAAGLNDVERERMGSLLADLAQDGLAILLVEHDMSFVMELSDRVTVLDFGRVIASGPPDLVRNDPVVVDAYLGSPEEEAYR